jgi:hypothetical protein
MNCWGSFATTAKANFSAIVRVTNGPRSVRSAFAIVVIAFASSNASLMVTQLCMFSWVLVVGVVSQPPYWRMV